MGFRVLGFMGFRVLGFGVLGFMGFRVLGFGVLGFRGLGCWVQGLGTGVHLRFWV